MIRKKEITRAELREQQLHEKVKGPWGREDDFKTSSWASGLIWFAMAVIGGLFLVVMILNLATMDMN